jgi:hypothetical protein
MEQLITKDLLELGVAPQTKKFKLNPKIKKHLDNGTLFEAILHYISENPTDFYNPKTLLDNLAVIDPKFLTKTSPNTNIPHIIMGISMDMNGYPTHESFFPHNSKLNINHWKATSKNTFIINWYLSQCDEKTRNTNFLNLSLIDWAIKLHNIRHVQPERLQNTIVELKKINPNYDLNKIDKYDLLFENPTIYIKYINSVKKELNLNPKTKTILIENYLTTKLDAFNIYKTIDPKIETIEIKKILDALDINKNNEIFSEKNNPIDLLIESQKHKNSQRLIDTFLPILHEHGAKITMQHIIKTKEFYTQNQNKIVKLENKPKSMIYEQNESERLKEENTTLASRSKILNQYFIKSNISKKQIQNEK